MSEWENLSRENILLKRKYYSYLIERISKIIPKLDQNIDHKEIGTLELTESFLEDLMAVMDQFLVENYLDFFQCPLIQLILKIFIVWGTLVSQDKV